MTPSIKRAADPSQRSSGIVSKRSQTEVTSVRILPSFVQDLPASLGHHEIQLLRAKGTFDLPPFSVINTVLEYFYSHVHWHVPILDTGCLVGHAGPCDPTGVKISLLLLYAILFVASPHVPAQVLCAAGYQTTDSLRCHSLNRAEVSPSPRREYAL